MEGWHLVTLSNVDIASVRYVKNGSAYLCAPEEYEDRTNRIYEEIYCGPITQYVSLLKLLPEGVTL